MCFLKKFERISAVPLSKVSVFEQTDAYSSDDSVMVQKSDNLYFGFDQIQTFPQKQSNQQMLMNLVSLLNFNSTLMSSLEKKINQNNQTLEDLSQQMCKTRAEQHSVTSIEHIQSEESIESSQEGHFSEEKLTQKLFGKKSYKYRLRLVDELSPIIYKQRNIAFSVQLTTVDGKVIRNSNIVHLCLGVSDSNGEWIAETKNGEAFMKGKTETELYHGQSNYSKIYPRDVSRNYESGKVNFVVYPKPSMLYYAGNNSSLESRVNCDEIEPLVIKDIVIRAKKKD